MRRLRKYILLLSLFVCVGLKAQVGYITCPNNNTVCAGTTGVMTFHDSILPIIKWELSTDGGTTWVNILNSDGDTSRTYYMIPNDICYRVIHNNGADTSAIYCINVDDYSNAGTITGGGEQCGVATGTMTVTNGTGTPMGWYMSQTAGGAYTPTGITGNSQSYNVSGTTYYAYIVKNGVCPADTAYDTISIVPYSNAGIISGSASVVCATSNTYSVNASGVTGEIVAWQSAPSLSGPWGTVGTNSSYSTSNLGVPTYYQLIVKSGSCPPDTSNTVFVNVDAASVAGTLSGGTNYCGSLPATGAMTLSGYTGNIIGWSTYNGSTWVPGPCGGVASCNYNIMSYGNVPYRVEVKSGVCPPAFSNTDTVRVSESSVAGNADASKDTICAYSPGGVITLTGATATEYHWEVSNNGTSWTPLPMFAGAFAGYSNLPPGTLYFHCVVNNHFCPPAVSNSVTIVVNPSPTVNIITNDTIIDQGTTISVTATGTGNPSWTAPPLGSITDISSPNTFNTNITAYLPGAYVLTVSDGSGCKDTDTIYIDMAIQPFSGTISNAMTPNGDGINDEFYVEKIEAYKTSSLKVFNEYGQLIYSASPYANDWKGTYNNARVPDGTYYYVLTIKDIDKEKEFKGYVTVFGGK